MLKRSLHNYIYQKKSLDMECCRPESGQLNTKEKWVNVSVKEQPKRFIKLMNSVGSKCSTKDRITRESFSSSKNLSNQKSESEFEKAKIDFVEKIKNWKYNQKKAISPLIKRSKKAKRYMGLQPAQDLNTESKEISDQGIPKITINSQKLSKISRLNQELKKRWQTNTLMSIKQVDRYQEFSQTHHSKNDSFSDASYLKGSLFKQQNEQEHYL